MKTGADYRWWPGVVVGLGFVAMGGSAEAGPCIDCNADGVPDIQFRDDHLVPMLPTGSASNPDVAALGDRAVVVFVSDAVTAQNPSGLTQVWGAWTDGLGCSWSPPEQLTTDPIDASRAPAVAFAANYVSVVYERAGVIFVRNADTATWPGLSFSTEEALSDLTVSGPAQNPDITGVAPVGSVHFHAVWQGTGSGGTSHIFFKRSLTCGLPGTWAGSGGAPTESDLTNLAGPPDFATSTSTLAQIAGDTFSRGPGASAVTVAFLNDNAIDNPVRSLYTLRSIDDGDSFFGGVSTNPLPLKVDEARTTALDPNVDVVALDSSDAGQGGVGNWSVALWRDRRATATAQDIMGDAELDDASGPLVNWASPDVAVETNNPAGAQPAVTANYLAGSVAGRAFLYFTYSRGGNPELNFRRASLNATSPALVTECAIGGPGFIRLTGSNPARTAGNAQFAAAADTVLASGASEQFVAWVDTRSGSPEIWWKSTDSVAPAPATALVAIPTTCPNTGFDVSWTAPGGECDLASFRVEWDDGSGPLSLLVPATATTTTLTGLIPNAMYTIRVFAVDEACNESVAVATTGTAPNCIAPVITQATPPGPLDSCNLAGAPGHRDGQIEPNEIMTDVYLPLANVGTGAATAISAVLTGPGQVIIGAVNTSTYADIPPGGGPINNDVPFSFQVRPNVQCGNNPVTINLTLTVTTAELPGGIPLTFSFQVPALPDCQACAANAVLQPEAPTLVDSCAFGGPGSGDSFPDPGESLTTIKLPIRGLDAMPPAPPSTPATNVRVTAFSSPTAGVTVVQGASLYPDVAPAAIELNATDFAIDLDAVNFPCSGNGAPLQIDLFVAYDQAINPVRLRYNIPTNNPACNTCDMSSCPTPIPAVTLLYAVRSGGDVNMQWTREPSATAYNVWYVAAKTSIVDATAAGFTASLCSAVPNCADTIPTATESCTHVGGVALGSLSFYQIRALCSGNEGL